MLRIGHITMQGINTVYCYYGWVQIKKIKERINNLAGIDIMSVIIIISLAILDLFLKNGLITVSNMKI